MSDQQAITQIQKEDATIRKAVDKVRGLLTPGETLLAYAVQSRWFAWTHRRHLVAATSNRFLLFRRGLFGGFTMDDHPWQELTDARLTEGVLGAALTVVHGGLTLVVDGLRKDQAQGVYVTCQAQEQAWREKNRVRGLEEMRAQSGGVQLGGVLSGGMASGGGSGEEGMVEKLEKAKAMLDKGLISEAEYDTIKARVIEKM